MGASGLRPRATCSRTRGVGVVVVVSTFGPTRHRLPAMPGAARCQECQKGWVQPRGWGCRSQLLCWWPHREVSTLAGVSTLGLVSAQWMVSAHGLVSAHWLVSAASQQSWDQQFDDPEDRTDEHQSDNQQFDDPGDRTDDPQSADNSLVTSSLTTQQIGLVTHNQQTSIS